MSEIKAIETKYNGYHFRSRLEARWAVFFDELGVKYEYESQGYDLRPTWDEYQQYVRFLSGDGGLWYLPDFYLPEYDWYVEIKPLKSLTDDDYPGLERVYLFSRTHRIIAITGTPGFDDSYRCTALQPQDAPQERSGYSFASGRKCDHLWLAKDGHQFSLCGADCTIEPKETSAHFALDFAYEAARSARF